MNNYSTWGYTYSKSQRCYETLVPESHKDEPKKFFRKPINPLLKQVEQSEVCPICHFMKSLDGKCKCNR